MKRKNKDTFSMVDGLVDILDFGTNILTATMIVKRNKRAINLLAFVTIGMSTLAVAVSVAQTAGIKKVVEKECLEVEDVVRDLFLKQK